MQIIFEDNDFFALPRSFCKQLNTKLYINRLAIYNNYL